jgi:regulatory protein
MPETPARSVRHVAMDLLSRREHTRAQLHEKLRARGFEPGEIADAIERLREEGLQSDARFAESWVYQRSRKGYGPLRIRRELAERGVDDALIGEAMDIDFDWNASMREQRSRKFGELLPEDYRERMRQARFLQNRGFSADAVMRLFR